MLGSLCKAITRNRFSYSFQSGSNYFKHSSLINQQRYFASYKNQKLPFEKYREVKELFRTIYHKLEKPSSEYNEFSKLFMSTSPVDPSKLEETRIKMHENLQHHTIFQELHNILSSLEEIAKMKKESPDTDLETQDLLDEETENFEAMLEEVQVKAVDLLVPADIYDSYNSINIEIRPG